MRRNTRAIRHPASQGWLRLLRTRQEQSSQLLLFFKLPPTPDNFLRVALVYASTVATAFACTPSCNTLPNRIASSYVPPPGKVESSCPRKMDSISREFGNWFEENKISGLDGYGNKADYVAESDLRKYWNRQRIHTVWHKEVTKQLPIPVESITENYLRIFSTLVYIAEHRIPSLVYLEDFNKWNIHDNNVLPYFEQGLSRIFASPSQGTNVLQAFKKYYFRFNPVVFGSGLHRKELSPQCILPLTFQKQLSGGCGDSVVIKKYEPHAAAGIEVSEKVIVVKEYPKCELEPSFENEVNVYISLSNTARKDVVSKYFLKYHGSFIQNQKGYILLEYANEGSLLDFFQRRTPPYTRETLYDLWNNLFELLLGLSILHDQNLTITTKQLRGVHQDLKPANIFVFREQNQGVYQYKFKIGDFGLTSFEFFDKNSNMSPDNKGGTMYSAPELTQIHEDTRLLGGGITEEADMWSFACVLFEFAVWSICGDEGREEFRALRCQEINQYPSHVNLGYGASFHDGFERIAAVDKMLVAILSRRRVFDDFTDGICSILLRFVLVPRTERRRRAKELYPLLKKTLNKYQSSETPSIERLPESSSSSPVSPASVRSKQRPRNSVPQLDCRIEGQRDFVNSPSSIHEHEYPNRSSVHSSPRSHPGLGQQTFESDFPITRAHSLGSKQRADDGGRGYMCSECRSNHIKELFCTAQICSGQCHRGTSHTVPKPTPGGERVSHTFSIDSTEILKKEDNGTTLLPAIITNSAKLTFSGDSREPSSQSRSPSGGKYPPRVRIDEVLRWIENGEKTELPGQAAALKLLKGRDQIFIIDDSALMRLHHWENTADTFKALAHLVSQVDPDGIELFFTSGPDKVRKSRWTRVPMFHRGEIKSLVDLVINQKNKVSENFCHMEFSLSTILEQVKNRLSSRQQRETSIYILTDALWDDPVGSYACSVDNPIRSLVKEMRKRNFMRTHISLQFILFGNNEVSKRRLKYLDDDLGKELQFDIVDCRFHGSSVWNMLLGGVIAAIDAIDDDSMQNNNDQSRSATVQELG